MADDDTPGALRCGIEPEPKPIKVAEIETLLACPPEAAYEDARHRRRPHPRCPPGRPLTRPVVAAVEDHGEGVFLGFDHDAIGNLQLREGVKARARQRNDGFDA